MAGKVTGGLLDEPYPIRSRGDVNRARVLPQVRSKRETAAPKASAPASAPAESEQPKGGFDYVVKRNRLMKRISARGGQRSGTRRA